MRSSPGCANWCDHGDRAMDDIDAAGQTLIAEVLAPFGARFAEGEPFRPVRIRCALAD